MPSNRTARSKPIDVIINGRTVASVAVDLDSLTDAANAALVIDSESGRIAPDDARRASVMPDGEPLADAIGRCLIFWLKNQVSLFAGAKAAANQRPHEAAPPLTSKQLPLHQRNEEAIARGLADQDLFLNLQRSADTVLPGRPRLKRGDFFALGQPMTLGQYLGLAVKEGNAGAIDRVAEWLKHVPLKAGQSVGPKKAQKAYNWRQIVNEFDVLYNEAIAADSNRLRGRTTPVKQRIAEELHQKYGCAASSVLQRWSAKKTLRLV